MQLQNSDEVTLKEGIKYTVYKNCDFGPISRNISKDTAKITIKC